ncbi:unnamed protein product, partial [Meganyctiphanes norvegica]
VTEDNDALADPENTESSTETVHSDALTSPEPFATLSSHEPFAVLTCAKHFAIEGVLIGAMMLSLGVNMYFCIKSLRNRNNAKPFDVSRMPDEENEYEEIDEDFLASLRKEETRSQGEMNLVSSDKEDVVKSSTGS